MNFLRTVIGACAGLRFYRVALDWSASDPFKHLVKLSAVLAAVCVLIMAPRAFRWAADATQWVEHDLKLPAFSIERGKVHSEAPQPAVRRAGDFLFILDTTGATPLTATGAVSGIIVTADRVFVWAGRETQPQVLPVAQLPEGRVDAAYFRELMTMLIWMLILPAMGMFFGLFATVALAQCALFSGLASLMERPVTPRFRFGQLFKLATLALTPASIVAAAYGALGWMQGFVPMIYLVVFGFYFSGAAAVCRATLMPQDTKKME